MLEPLAPRPIGGLSHEHGTRLSSLFGLDDCRRTENGNQREPLGELLLASEGGSKVLFLPMAFREVDTSLVPRPVTVAVPTVGATPTASAQPINGCGPDELDRCRYQPSHWLPATAVRVLTGYSVSNHTEGRELPIIMRAARGLSGTRPVVVWSHGGGPRDEASLAMNREWATTLARAGYVVVQPAHVSPDRTALCAKLGITEPAKCWSLNPMTWYRPTDARAVLDALPQLAATVPELTGRMDAHRVAYAGHSFGAFTSMAVAGARIDYVTPYMDKSWAHPLPRAFVALSPQGPGRFGFHEGSWRKIERPVLTASGAGDTTGEAPLGEQAEERREPFRRMPPGDKYELWIDSPDAIHATFNLSDSGLGARFHEPIAMTVLAYLDAYLLDSAAAKNWLASSNVEVLTGGVGQWQGR